ncbi:invasion associated locus B family protein [Roseibium sediminicola]|uniref:Invasion associated locus B family protein n=1 Tax=Roseibium sediminicola TaxID=2933272 RepID=A0ABT0GME1_9HYPH|nr:invasion associated locus B family protein [Roseibium sp. CAU 1639]MCK7610568.1 invasion associated locus B family protein [Roseibium sp. CAU 1639]
MAFFRKQLILAASIAALVPAGGALAQETAQENAQEALWQTRCGGPARAAETLICEASQILRIKENGQLLFKVDVIYPANKGTPVFQMQAPLGFYLPGKVKLAVDGTPLTELEVGTCDQRGCYISADATPEMIDAMKAGTKLQIDFAPAADRRQSVDVPLTGFTKAMDAIQ